MPDAQGNPTPEERFTPKLPKQLQDQVDAVNAAMTTQPDGRPPVQEPPENPDDNQQDDNQEQEDYDQPEDGQDPPAEESWEQRARSAQGRLDSMFAQHQQAMRRISELEDQLTGKQIRQQPPQPASNPDQYAKPQLIKAEERDDYGDEFFDVVGRRAREEFSPELMALGERLKRLEGSQQAVTQVIDRTQKRSVYDQLYDEVPNWREINTHPAFKQWVAQIDPYSGRPLAELLSDAMARHDGQRVVNFFRGFAEAAGLPSNPSSPGPEAPPLTNGNGSGRPSLEDFAAPGRARSAPQSLPPDKPVYTHAQIAKISDDKRRGLWRGREAELDAIERDIFAAQHEGRIQ